MGLLNEVEKKSQKRFATNTASIARRWKMLWESFQTKRQSSYLKSIAMNARYLSFRR